MKKIELSLHQLIFSVFLTFFLSSVAGGFGYFFGREEQVLLNHKPLVAIPDINKCFP